MEAPVSRSLGVGSPHPFHARLLSSDGEHEHEFTRASYFLRQTFSAVAEVI